MATVADPAWVEVDPMGHEHRFDGNELPTLDEQFRCRRCGHRTTPHFLEEIIPAGVFDPIVDIKIEMRSEPLEVSTLSGSETLLLPGPIEAVLHVLTTRGEREVLLDDLEIKEAEKYLADIDGLRTFAKWVFARRGIML